VASTELLGATFSLSLLRMSGEKLKALLLVHISVKRDSPKCNFFVFCACSQAVPNQRYFGPVMSKISHQSNEINVVNY
jgi:hypothetical protein